MKFTLLVFILAVVQALGVILNGTQYREGQPTNTTSSSLAKLTSKKDLKKKTGPVWTLNHRSSHHLIVMVTCKSFASSLPWALKSSEGTVGMLKAADKKKSISCDYLPYTGTLALCLQKGAKSPAELKKGLGSLYLACPKLKYDKLMKIYENATENHISEADAKKLKKVNEAVMISDATYKELYAESLERPLSWDRGVKYSFGLLWYWFGVMVLLGLLRLVRETGLARLLKIKIVKKAQATFLLPSMFSQNHHQPLKFLWIFTSYIPTRLEAAVLSGYLIMCWIFMFIHLGDAMFLRNLADRTGIIATAHLPLIFLFAGRNNFLQWVTGFNYTAFIHFHKWTGRMMFINAVIHASTYTKLCIDRKTWHKVHHQEYYAYGVLAVVIAGLMMFQLYNWFRQRTYEFFLVGHIIFAVFFMLGAYKHLFVLGFMEFVYSTLAVWAFDRLIRLVRIAYFGVRKAHLNIISEDTFKLTVKKPKGWKAKPGQYVFVYFLSGCSFVQSHPFTVNDSNLVEGEINLYIKCKNGITKTIYKKLLALEKQALDMRVLIEGPYGHSAPNRHYDNINLIAGGNGIPGIFDHAMKLGTKYKDGQKNIRLLWVAHDLALISWFLPELHLLRNTPVSVTLFLTRELGQIFTMHSGDGHDKDLSEKTDSEKPPLTTSGVSSNGALLSDFDVVCARPDLQTLVNTWFQEDQGSSSVTACGPGVLCDQLRKSIASHVEKHSGRVDYHEELQIW